MGAPKGHKRYGGRQKGTPNKPKLTPHQKAIELGIDPFEILLMFADNRWEELGCDEPLDPSLRASCAAKASAYLYPQLKAVEHSGEINTPSPKINEESLEDRVKKHEGK